MTPNVLDSIGYAIEKMHTGMIEYLCDLFNAGQREPLRSFFSALDPTSCFEDDIAVAAAKESAYLDLVIKKVRRGQPDEFYIGIEMKVDSHEHSGQTKRYYEVLKKNQPEMERFFFMTLGMGEYYLSPDSPEFKWVQLADCLAAVSGIQTPDANIKAWLSALEREQRFRDYCTGNDFGGFQKDSSRNTSRQSMWRNYGWNLCFLGELKKQVETLLPPTYLLRREPAVYFYGQRPDVILSLQADDYNADGSYIEINNNGLLNLKVNATNKIGNKADIASVLDTYKFSHIAAGVAVVKRLPPHSIGTIKSKTKTVKSYDVGIEVVDGIMQYRTGEGQGSVARRLSDIAAAFYSKNP